MGARFLLLALLFALPVLVLALLQFQHESDAVQSGATAAVNSAADALASRLEQDLSGAAAVATAFGAADLGRSAGVAACSAASKRAAAATGARSANYVVANPQGEILCSGVPLRHRVNVADRPYFQQTLQSGRPTLSGLLNGRLSGLDNVRLAVPILDADGRVTAVAIAALTAAALVSQVPAHAGPPVTLALFDRDGLLVSRSPELQRLPRGHPAQGSALFRNRAALTREVKELQGLDGVSRLYTSRAIQLDGETVLWAMSGVDVGALGAATLTSLRRDAGMVLLLALLMVGVAFVVTRTLVLQRYRGLFGVAADVAVGRYSSRVAVTIQDDITAVEVALNGMLDAVEARELELRDARRLAGLGNWSLDADGSVEWSPEIFEIFGRDPALGAPHRAEHVRLLTADSLVDMESSLRTMLADGQPYRVELEGIRPDGTHRWMVARGEPVRDATGVVTGARGTALDITERKLAEQAVQRSQRQLRHVMDGLGPSMFVGLLTPQGILIEVNQSPLTAAGIRAQDVLGLPLVDTPWWLGVPEAGQQLVAAIERGAGGQSTRCEMRVRGREDSFIDLDFSLQPLRDESGEVIFLIPSASVITERKRAEVALRESEAEFRTLADAMSQIVWATRPDGWNTYLNQRWTDYTGLSAAEGAGHEWQRCFHPDDQQRAWEAWQVAKATGGVFALECQLRRADGAYRWWLLRSEPQRDAAGAVFKWVGTGTDIHNMKQAELEITRANGELKQQQTELRVLFDLMPAVILFKDGENRILRINKHGAYQAGLRVDEIEGRLAQDIFQEMGAAGHLADLEVIRSGKPQLGTVQLIRDVRGNDLWVQRDRMPYRDDSGTVIGIVLMVQDITARKRGQDALRELNTDLESRVRDRTAELSLARSQAEEASRAKSDFLAAMSHEIRTPMSGLLGLLELLQLSPLDNDQHSTLELARDSGNGLLSIIDDILDFSKIEANRLELNLVASSVRSVVENACRLHAQVASAKDLVLHFHVAPQINPLLAVDPLRLGQILNNFLSNAIKFTHVGSIELVVDVVAQREGIQDLRFVVRDTGIGMSEQQLGRLFQPFVQAQASTSTTFGGTGLGLVIARRLAALMGGTVEIESVPGTGTTLTLLLSLEICDAFALGPPTERGRREMLEALVLGRRSAPSIEDAQAEGTLLLVVDDHPTNRLVLVRQLASLGYAALAAVDGVEALAMWRGHRFGAVITDCNMPRMNGYELTVAIRCGEQLQGLDRIPVIACTANALPAAVDSCIAAGMDDYIVKPADLTQVSRKLDRWVPLAGGQAVPGVAPALLQVRSEAMSSEGLLDLELLDEISGGSAPARLAMLADFRRVNDLDAASLRSAADAGDFPQVLTSAHRIKGASLMLGAALLSETCGRVETAGAAGAAGDPADLRIAMDSFEAELLRLNSYLEAMA